MIKKVIWDSDSTCPTKGSAQLALYPKVARWEWYFGKLVKFGVIRSNCHSSKYCRMAMDVKGITWVGDIYQKFENMCLEVEDIMFEDAVKYVENQVQTVGESVKKIYSDIMQDILPPPSCDLDEKVASELPIDQYTEVVFCKKKFQGSEKISVKADSKRTRINHDVDYDVIHAASCDTDALFMSARGSSLKGNNFTSQARQYVGSTDVKSNLGSNENQQNKKMSASNTASEITLFESDRCRTSQSCELSNENQNHAVTVSKLDSAEVTRFASVSGCCNEIENASTEQMPDVLIVVKSAEEKEMNMSAACSVLFGDPDETWSLDATKIDAVLDHGHKTMQQGDEKKLEETCVMVTRDELQIVPKAGANLKSNKKQSRGPFSLSKKSARKQEYKDLAILHGNKEKLKGDCMENICPTLLEDHKKLMLPDISEAEWELL